MTTPGGAAPDGSFVLGTVGDSQSMTESSIKTALKAGAVGTSGSYTQVQNNINSEIKVPLAAATAGAAEANTAAEAAANDAANALDSAYKTNLAEIGNVESADARAKYPAPSVNPGTMWRYQNTFGLASSGIWYLILEPPATTYDPFSLMQIGPSFKVEPTEKLYMRWYQRRANSANFSAGIVIGFYDASGTWLSSASAANPTSSAPDATHVAYSGSVTVPTSAASAIVYAFLNQGAGGTLTGAWTFDDITVSRSAAQTVLLGEIASYWEAECVVASSAVLLGVNELLIGLCQNVPIGRSRVITDIHYAFSDKPGTMTIEMKKWNAAGTSASVIHTATIRAGVTRINYSGLALSVADKERVFWNVTASSANASVLQALIFGAIV